jgi:L-seryl-tRNA(Ser) seleniumtransferase
MFPFGSKLTLTRRNLLRNSTLIGAAGALECLLPGRKGHASSIATAKATGANLYEQIGVRPLINCKGTYTIISGSLSLPEVKEAMDEASQHYVHLDELMEAVGVRLAKITGAEWGIITAGCAAAITAATAACIAGTDPEKSQKLPHLAGLKNQVIIPKHSRNPYDVGTRMLGVEVVEIDSTGELKRNLGPQTAMVYVLSSPEAATGPLSIANICKIAREKEVPVFVDAAAENLTIPNIHLQAGATFVGYSGGKCLRGPQCAGLLLGQKDLVQSAWFHSAPHHNVGRSLKVGKEEIMGLLTAVEVWTRRDHQAEWNTWMSWLGTIEKRVKPLPSVTTEYLQPEDLSNHAPRLRIRWDADVLKITGTELSQVLDAGTPRIQFDESSGTRPKKMKSSLTIMPYMMMPGDDKIAADAIYATLSHPPAFPSPAAPSGAPANIAGIWDVTVTYLRGTGHQRFLVEQDGESLAGAHQGTIYQGNMKGEIAANQISLHSALPVGGNEIHYSFVGVVDGDNMSGDVTLGEYGKAKWSATRNRT